MCPIKIIPAALLSTTLDRNNICVEFCRFHLVTLRGCKRCVHDIVKPIKPPKPLKNNAGYFASPIEPHRIDFPANSPPQPNMLLAPYESPVDFQASSTEPTTPDWNRLCATLCRQVQLLYWN